MPLIPTRGYYPPQSPSPFPHHRAHTPATDMSSSIESLGEPTPRPTRKPPSRSSTPEQHNSSKSFRKHLHHALSDIAGVSNLHLAGGAVVRGMNVGRVSYRPTTTEEDWNGEGWSRCGGGLEWVGDEGRRVRWRWGG